MRTSQFLLTASIVALSAPSFAATSPTIVAALQINAGSGFLNSGRGFRPIGVDTEVAPGDSVMVAPGGSVEIVYFDNCRVPVKPGQVTVVARISPCARGQVDPGHAAHAAKPQDNSIYYLLGGAAAAGIGAAALVLSKGSSSPAPASP